ncbi:pyridoxal phosphate-dependent transferase [Lactarius hengduanensis]|nr:pyridoxal phosphate-dependent transferase [Lactarius hengduanensis]
MLPNMISPEPFSYFLPRHAPSSPRLASPEALHESRLASPRVEVYYTLPYNPTGLAGNETIKVHAIETLRKYGVGSCGPPGFYGTIGFSTIPFVISAFAKRGDVIFADRGISFTIQKGLQISRFTIRWFDHNDLKSLEDRDVLLTVEKECRQRRRGPLTRRFIITEGIFEEDGTMVDLPKHIELKHNISFGKVERAGRGFRELYNVPATQIDMIVGSVANGINSSGGFCAGSRIVVDHQCINGTSFVFSAAVALLAVSASEGINILRNTPPVLSTLLENVRAIRAVLDRVEAITIPSQAASPIIHIHLRSSAPAAYVSAKPSNPTTPAPREAPSFDIVGKERLLRGQELVEARQSTRLDVTAALSGKERERAARVIKAVVAKVLAKCK